MKDPDSGRRLTVVVVSIALLLFGLLWLTIDSNVFSSVHGAP